MIHIVPHVCGMHKCALWLHHQCKENMPWKLHQQKHCIFWIAYKYNIYIECKTHPGVDFLRRILFWSTLPTAHLCKKTDKWILSNYQTVPSSHYSGAIWNSPLENGNSVIIYMHLHVTWPSLNVSFWMQHYIALYLLTILFFLTNYNSSLSHELQIFTSAQIESCFTIKLNHIYILFSH